MYTNVYEGFWIELELNADLGAVTMARQFYQTIAANVAYFVSNVTELRVKDVQVLAENHASMRGASAAQSAGAPFLTFTPTRLSIWSRVTL